MIIPDGGIRDRLGCSQRQPTAAGLDRPVLQATKRITMKTGGDPRLHVFETIVREQGIDMGARKDVKIEDIMVTNTLKS